MQERRVMDVVESGHERQSRMTRRAGIAAVVAVIWLVPLVSASALGGSRQYQQAGAKATSTAYITNGSALWESDTQTTAATSGFSLDSTHGPYVVDPTFQTYYANSEGETTFGAPVTAAFPVRQGWVQFFVSGALLLPRSQGTAASATNVSDLSDEIVRDGLVDVTSGIVRLPVVHALLTAGSEIPIGGENSELTYATLRDATRAEAMVPAPANATVVTTPTSTSTSTTATATATTTATSTATTSGATATAEGISGNVFVPGGTRETAVVGHVIPAAIWRYINEPSIAPDGWQTDFGSPLTEAIPFTATVNGSPHALLAQVFWQEALLVDTTAVNAAGQPAITPLSAGLDYLRTLGPPATIVATNEQAWGLSDMAVLNTPATGNALAHVGMNFPLSMTGQTQWLESTLWYGVRWKELKSSGAGWAPAQAITFTPPGNAPAYAGFDVLSPDLAHYLSGLGSNVGAVAYDLTRNTYYTYNASDQFIVASSVKVPIMLTFLTMTESQGRQPNGNELYLLQTMIENSNNDSAQALFDEIGGVGPIEAFLRSVHIGGFNGDPDAWGWSTITPMAMVQLLTLLHEGKVLTAQDRSLALNLMENIESDEQIGVGSTAPSGATVAMKDGWVPAPDGLWAMNSSGIVTVGNETYIIAVYSQHQQSLGDGWAITEQVCGPVGQILG